MDTLYVTLFIHFCIYIRAMEPLLMQIGTEVLTRHPSVTNYINHNLNFRYEMNLVVIPSQAGPGGKKFHYYSR